VSLSLAALLFNCRSAELLIAEQYTNVSMASNCEHMHQVQPSQLSQLNAQLVLQTNYIFL